MQQLIIFIGYSSRQETMAMLVNNIFKISIIKEYFQILRYSWDCININDNNGQAKL